jgi:transcriptional regulator with XRE-family HTH domain
MIFAGVAINATHVANMCGVERTAVWRILSGDRDPRLSTARKIAAALGMNHLDFLREIELRQEERAAVQTAQVKAYEKRVEKENLEDINDYKHGRPVKPRPSAFRLPDVHSA